jgi:DNA helicase-2/ATP-dependent DNA helicase PcrA
LNIRQRKVIKTKDETLLVLAGPGTGKTEVLAHRILHLVSAGVDLQEILAVTFSRKAANEMAERLCHSLGVERDLVNVSTLHAEALRGVFLAR